MFQVKKCVVETLEEGALVKGRKPPLYLTYNLSGGQLPPLLWRWFVGLLSHKKVGKSRVGSHCGKLKRFKRPIWDLQVILYNCGFRVVYNLFLAENVKSESTQN